MTDSPQTFLKHQQMTKNRASEMQTPAEEVPQMPGVAGRHIALNV